MFICCQVRGCFIESLEVIVILHFREMFNIVKFVTVKILKIKAIVHSGEIFIRC